MQTFVSEQYALEAWEMKLFFVQTFYVNVDSRCSKNAEILGTFKIDKILGLKTLKNIDTGFTNLVYVFMLYKNRGLLMLTHKEVVACLCKNLVFCLIVLEVCEKINNVYIFWYHYEHSMAV